MRREKFPVLKGEYLREVPWSMIAPYEKQARSNHSQTLERLAERGGLSPGEMLCVFAGCRWSEMQYENAERELIRKLFQYLATGDLLSPRERKAQRSHICEPGEGD